MRTASQLGAACAAAMIAAGCSGVGPVSVAGDPTIAAPVSSTTTTAPTSTPVTAAESAVESESVSGSVGDTPPTPGSTPTGPPGSAPARSTRALPPAEADTQPSCPGSSEVAHLTGVDMGLRSGGHLVTLPDGTELNVLECTFSSLIADSSQPYRYVLTSTSLTGGGGYAALLLIENPDPATVTDRDDSFLGVEVTSRWSSNGRSSQCVTTTGDGQYPDLTWDIVVVATPANDIDTDCGITEEYFWTVED